MKQEFINDVHNYIDLDTTEEETKENNVIPELNPQVFQIDENIVATTNRNDE